MANIKISNLPVASSVSGSDSFPVVQSGVTKQATKSVLFASPTFTGTTSADIVAASGNVSFDGGTFVFNESGADKDARFEGDGDPALLFLDASTDRVGISTVTPQVLLDVTGDSTNTVINIRSTSNGASSFDGSGAGLQLLAGAMNTTSKYTPAIKFGSTDSDFTTTNPKFGAAIIADAAQTYSSDTSGGMGLSFWTAPTSPGTGSGLVERVRITSDGYLRLASGGIQFNGDTSSDNALNDYEEGTWTPVLSDASTGGNVAPSGTFTGSYTKVGRIVTVTVLVTNFDTTGMTAGNDLFIQGLPFTARSVASTQFFTGACILGFATVLNNPVLSIPDNSSYMRIAESVVSSGIDFMIVSEFSSGNADIYGTITYETA